MKEVIFDFRSPAYGLGLAEVYHGTYGEGTAAVGQQRRRYSPVTKDGPYVPAVAVEPGHAYISSGHPSQMIDQDFHVYKWTTDRFCQCLSR